jgi:hypothetical protein
VQRKKEERAAAEALFFFKKAAAALVPRAIKKKKIREMVGRPKKDVRRLVPQTWQWAPGLRNARPINFLTARLLPLLSSARQPKP